MHLISGAGLSTHFDMPNEPDTSVCSSIVPPNIEALIPYPPGKPLSELARELGVESAIKLASNENAYGPSPKAMEAVKAAVSEVHRYPDGGAWFLRDRLAEHVGVPGEGLLLGNGSNEVIELLIRAFCDRDHGVLTSETTFVVYSLISQAAGVPFRSIPMKGLGYDLDAIARAVDSSTRLIFLCNPNNPTGTLFSQEVLDKFVETVGPEPIIVLDEAYIEFVPEAERVDALALLKRRPRTVILRTFSKAYGLAGLRVGYGITHPGLADYANRVRQPFNVNHLAQVGALAALDDQEYLDQVIADTRASLDRFAHELTRMGMIVTPSDTNFMLFDCGRDSWPIYQALLREGVIVRPMKAYALPTYLRVNAGTDAENDRFLETFERVL
ncbi:MAG: histidinol-phosphate aminotransferase [Myxococcota bacterium]